MGIADVSPEELDLLEKRFRSVTHSIANWLTVIKTLSKLRENNPLSYDNLAKSKLLKSVEIVGQLHDLAAEINERFSPCPLPEDLQTLIGE